jgi:chitin synthase
MQFNITASKITQVNWYTVAKAFPGQDATLNFTRTAADFPLCKDLNFRAAKDEPCDNTVNKCVLGPAEQHHLFQPRTSSPQVESSAIRLGPRVRLQVLPRNRRRSPQLRVLHSGPPNTYRQRRGRYRHPHRALRTTNYGRERWHEALLQPRRAAAGRAVPGPAVLCGEHRQESTAGCFISTLFLYVSLVVIMGIVLARFAMACVFNWFMSSRLIAAPKNLNRRVISPAVMPEGANINVDSKNGTAPWAVAGNGQ